jgi:hypothetical protein
MTIPFLPLKENDRLNALNECHLLDTLPEEYFDNIDLISSTFIDITKKKKQEKKLQLLDYSFKNIASTVCLILKDDSFFDFYTFTKK